MDKYTAMILVVLAGIGICMGLLIADVGSGEDGESFHIEYVTGDATGDNPNPDSYVSGHRTALMPMSYEDNVPDEDGLQAFFGGWYLDPYYEELFMEIAPDTTGDLTLYAKWQEDVVGRSITLAFSGTVHDGILNSYTMAGEQTITYRFTNDEHRGYYMTYDTTTTYDHGFSQYTKTDSFGDWNDGDGTMPQPIGNQVLDTVYGKKNCTVFGNSSFMQWIGDDDGMIYRIVEESRGFITSKYVEYVLASSTVVEVVNEIDVTGYADNGITVTGSGVYSPTDDIVLTATAAPGTVFTGWYDQYGKLLSPERTYSTEAGWNDLEFYALNDANPDYTTETFTETSIGLDTGLPSPSWSICRFGSDGVLAEGTGDTLTYTFEDTGLYEIYIEDASGYHGYRTLEIAGDVVRTFNWTYGNNAYSLTMTMDYDKVQEYRDMLPVDERHMYIVGGKVDRDRANQFVTYKDPYIQELASRLSGMSSGMNDVDRANFVLAFLQDIEYQSDEVYMGAEEYWKFPVETLYDKGGDCEDSSILYCAIVKAMGYDTALFVLDGHMMSGISVQGKVSGSYEVCPDDGKRYYYVETTSDNAKIGQKSNGAYAWDVIKITDKPQKSSS